MNEMITIEQNRFFQTEFSLFAMSDGEAIFWDKYLNEVDEANPGVLFFGEYHNNEKARFELFMFGKLQEALDRHIRDYFAD